jgi:outer membrane lipoprotein-sorting protein
MKKIFLIAAILTMVTVLKAQQNDKSKDILDKVTENTKSFKTISANFIYSMDNDEMDIHEKNEGSIIIKGKKYVVSIPESGYQIYSDGTTIWTYMKNGNQVTISNIDDAGNELVDPANLFNIYEKGYKSKFVEEKILDGKALYIIDLFPETDDQDVKKITVNIDKATMMIHSARLSSTDGNIYGIDIKKLETNQDLPDSDFIFDKSKYPDLEVIDLR